MGRSVKRSTIILSGGGRRRHRFWFPSSSLGTPLEAKLCSEKFLRIWRTAASGCPGTGWKACATEIFHGLWVSHRLMSNCFAKPMNTILAISDRMVPKQSLG
jgi:hypothetical protein